MDAKIMVVFSIFLTFLVVFSDDECPFRLLDFYEASKASGDFGFIEGLVFGFYRNNFII
jgi:hypothetical protein